MSDTHTFPKSLKTCAKCGYRLWNTDGTQAINFHKRLGENICVGCVPTPVHRYNSIVDSIKKTQFTKHDKDKPRLDLIPHELVLGLGEILRHGAEKYGDNNWATGADWSRYFAASQRHLWAWWSGEDEDPESRLNHLLHATCCIAFLIAYQSRDLGRDDRPKVQD